MACKMIQVGTGGFGAAWTAGWQENLASSPSVTGFYVWT